jgi:IclR family pca regulon transcriptional regulator
MRQDVTNPDLIQSLERGFAVLLAFDADHPRPTVVELAKLTGLSRPSVRRILLTLQSMGYVTCVDGRWILTARVLSIAQHYSASNALLGAAMPRLMRVAELTQESASLGLLDDVDVVYAARVPVRRIMSIDVSVGTRVPAYATSMGRALLAWSPPNTVQSVLDRTRFEKLADSTIIDPGELMRELESVRATGYALVVEELEKGLISLSAPVFDSTQAVVGAIACSTSTARYTADEFRKRVARTVVESAAELSADVGYTPPRRPNQAF